MLPFLRLLVVLVICHSFGKLEFDKASSVIYGRSNVVFAKESYFNDGNGLLSSEEVDRSNNALHDSSVVRFSYDGPHIDRGSNVIQIVMSNIKLQLVQLSWKVKLQCLRLKNVVNQIIGFFSKMTFKTTQSGVQKVIESDFIQPLTIGSVITWAGKQGSSSETLKIAQVRKELQESPYQFRSNWANNIHDVEILRFLRAKHNLVAPTLKALVAHDAWRISEFGPEGNFSTQAFPADQMGNLSPVDEGPPVYNSTIEPSSAIQISPLRFEGFWLGYDLQGCPTLVLRTQVHDGAYYNDDPSIYTAFLVRLIEEGRNRYGVGIDKQMCVLIDRAGQVFRNSKPKKESVDMAVIPNLVELFRHLYSVLSEQYPDLLEKARIAPASWFFSFCYRITSRVMAPHYRHRFQMLQSHDLSTQLHPFIPPPQLPSHLGGTDLTSYRSEINVTFDPAKSYYLIVGKHKSKSARFPEKARREAPSNSSLFVSDLIAEL